MTEKEKQNIAQAERELEIATRIETARINVRAGHFTPHEEVIAETFAIIDAALNIPSEPKM